MNHIGIIAYGSLIDDPGKEIEAKIVARVRSIKTPFKVEFARSSHKTRDGSPTLIPVEVGGVGVLAEILVLEENVSLEKAQNMLWRRETRKIQTAETYSPPRSPGTNDVIIERLNDFHGIDVVLYTKIAPNIKNVTSQKLAELAIESAGAEAGTKGMDGISYLIASKRNGVFTPLMPDYESEILRRVGADGLEEALRIVKAQTS